MSGEYGLHEPDAPDAVPCAGAGKALSLGLPHPLGWHLHGAPVFTASVHGDSRWRMPGGDGTVCLAAAIPARAPGANRLRGQRCTR